MPVSGLFLPFTPRGKATELRAIDVKTRLGLTAEAAVDPYEASPRIPARLINVATIRDESPMLACALFTEHVDAWSAIGYGRSPVTGEALILLNPTHAATRCMATLMEEIVHLLPDHPPSRLELDDGLPARRDYDTTIEDEAYTVGAACLLPYPALFHAVNDIHQSAAAIAARYRVSAEYVTFRIKRAGLGRIFNKYCARGKN